jgi:predicted nucleic acid-binding protein
LTIALDTSVLIDMVNTSSVRHVATWNGFKRYQSEGVEFLIAEHSILEAFSVLSRAPAPVGIRPADAQRALRDRFGNMRVAPIHQGLAWETIGHTLSRGHWGGRVYDAMIALAVFSAGATVILTWDFNDFLSIAPAGLEVREPS